MHRGIILLFSVLSFQVSAQETDIGKDLFPDNENAQWLVSLLGQPISKKVWKQFKRKIGDMHDTDDMYDDYAGEVYPKNTPAVRTGHYDKVTVYNLSSYVNGSSYSSMRIKRHDSAPRFSFMNAATIKDLEQLIEGDPNLESTRIQFSEKGGHIDFLHHSAKFFIEVTYRYGDGNIFVVEVSKGEYESIAQKTLALKESKKASQYAEELELRAQKILASTDVRFDEKIIDITSNQVKLYDPKVKDHYQIINIRYEGPLQNGVPHGVAEWGIVKEGESPSGLDLSVLAFTGKATFKNGKPVDEHIVNTGNKTMIYTYEAGRLKEAHEKDGNFYIYFKDNGTQDEVSAMPFNYGTWVGLKYSGKIDKNRKPHDTNGVLSFGQGKKATVHFEHGVLKEIMNASFVYEDAVLTGDLNGNLQLTGKVNIKGNEKNNIYSGYVYFLNGEPDLSKEGYLKFDDFNFSNDLKGEFEVRGKIKMIDYSTGTFEGEALEFSFAEYPDTKFKGDLKKTSWGATVTGWHTVTEYKNGIAQSSLKGRYTPKGDFLEGDNFYQKGESVVYDQSTMTDPRDGKTYKTKTFKVKERGEYKLLTWMLEDLNYEPLADEKSKVRGWDLYIMYYSQDKAKRACPRGWRLPYSSDYDIIPIDASIKDSQEKNIARIRKLGLNRNGYVYRMFGKYEGELRREGKEVHYWLQNDRELSISEINFGSPLKVENNYSYFTCRCVKEEKL